MRAGHAARVGDVDFARAGYGQMRRVGQKADERDVVVELILKPRLHLPAIDVERPGEDFLRLAVLRRETQLLEPERGGRIERIMRFVADVYAHRSPIEAVVGFNLAAQRVVV